MRIDNAEFSGSITGTEAIASLSGSFSGSFQGQIIGTIDSASYAHTASFLLGSIESASFATTASHALTASLLLGSVESASFATTASYAETASYADSVVSASHALRADNADSVVSASYATTSSFAVTASQLTPSNGTASVSGHLIPTDSGSHDLGSLENPFRDLYISTSSLNFVRNGQIVSVVNGGNEFIQVGNIIIGTSSIAYASGSEGILQNIITVDTASESNMVTLDGGDSHYTGSFTGSFTGELIGSITSASYAESSSLAQDAISSSHALSADTLGEPLQINTSTTPLYSQATVTVLANKFTIDGTSQQRVSLAKGHVYRFDQSNSTNTTHPLRFSTTPDGTHGGGSEYTTGVTKVGTPGSAGAYIEIIIEQDTPQLYYYCENHANYGGDVFVGEGNSITTASINDNTLTFTKGDGTTFNLVVITSSGGGGGGESIASLNTFTSSIQSEVDALQGATGSYITNVSVNDNTLTVQRNDSSSFNLLVITSSGGGEGESISALNNHTGSVNTFTSSIQNEVDAIQTFTSSIQNEVDALQLVTNSYVTNISVNDNTLTVQRKDSSSFDLLIITSSGGGGGESIASLNTFTSSIQSEVDALQTFTSSVQSEVDAIQTFTSSIQSEVDAIQTFTSSIQGEVDAIQGETGSYITNVSVNDNTLTIQRQDSSSFDLLVITSSGGGGSTDTLEYNNTVRYTVTSGSDNAEIVCTGDVYKNLSWSRSSTTLTITSNSHGLAVGDVVHIRNMSEDYVAKDIQSVTTNTFTVTVANSGDTSGTEGVYVPVPRLSTLDGLGGSVVFDAPSVGAPQMQSAKLYFNAVEVDTINIDVPAGVDDGFGTNAALTSRFIPQVIWYRLDGSNPVLTSTATIGFSKTSNHARYTIAGGNIDSFLAAVAMLRF